MQRQRWGAQGERSCGWPGPPPLNREGPLPLRGTGNLGPSLRGVEGQPFLSRAEGDGNTAIWASLRAGGGEGGGGAESEEEGSLV